MFLYGASGHAKVIIEILEKSGIQIDGLFDDNPNIENLFNYPCSLFEQDKIKDKQIIISIGDNKIRKTIANKVGKCNFGKAIDTGSFVSQRAIIGAGTVIMPGVSVNSGSKTGEHVIINTNASIDHDCVIDNFVHVSPGCSISGNVNIGEGTHIGTGASIIPNIRIGKWCIVGAGSVIISDIPDFSVIVGNPGRIIKKNII